MPGETSRDPHIVDVNSEREGRCLCVKCWGKLYRNVLRLNDSRSQQVKTRRVKTRVFQSLLYFSKLLGFLLLSLPSFSSPDINTKKLKKTETKWVRVNVLHLTLVLKVNQWTVSNVKSVHNNISQSRLRFNMKYNLK